MKNIAVNNLKYTGIVTISQYIGDKKVKITESYNSGGNPLFNFLADCLVGDFDIAKISRPTKIMLLSEDENGDLIDKSGFIYLITKPEKVASNMVKYSFIISRAILDGINDIKYIGLYNNAATERSLDEYSAIAAIKIDSATLSTSSMLVVDWKLIISNEKSKEDL